jgi:isopentenyl phosphate kinase
MFLIKLGGSIITDKTTEGAFRHDTVTRLATELKTADKDSILVHGAGSFGHILAKQHHLNDGLTQPSQTLGFAQTQASVQRLNTLVIDALHHQGLPAISLPPHAITILDNHHLKTMDFTMFSDYLDQGFLPVTYGDVALDTTLHGSICSGDLLMYVLAAEFHPEKVIFVMDEDGLYTANPKTHPTATFIENISIKDLPRLSTGLDSRADVTKGMQGKLETISSIAQLGIDVILVNGNVKNRLHDILQGTPTRCTTIQGAHP